MAASSGEDAAIATFGKQSESSWCHHMRLASMGVLGHTLPRTSVSAPLEHSLQVTLAILCWMAKQMGVSP